jgi:polar amino acid transport system substrate-binding protein
LLSAAKKGWSLQRTLAYAELRLAKELFMRPLLYLFIICIALPAVSVSAKPLQLLVGVEKPPYIKVATKAGYELELLQAVVKGMGFQSKFIHVPNGRLLDLFSDGQADLVSLQRTTPPGFYATHPYISYQNVLIVRQDLQKELLSLNDLVGLRVMAFQNATLFLPPDYAEAVAKADSYQEMVEQHSLPALLLKNRVDVLVMDRNIFLHYYRQTAPDDHSLKILSFFKPNHYHMLARSPEVAERFNKALADLKQSELFSQLQLKYFAEQNQ